MIAAKMPKLSEQRTLYPPRLIEAAGGRPVTFRTLDIGGDKVLPYMRTSTRRTRRWAGAPSASASTGPRFCARNCALLHAAADR